MKPASVIGAVIQTHSLFDWQFDLSPEALPNCSATQVVLASEKAVAYSYKSHQSHGGNPSPKKPILQCQDHVLASTCSTSQDTAPLYSCQMWCDSAELLFKENKQKSWVQHYFPNHPPSANQSLRPYLRHLTTLWSLWGPSPALSMLRIKNMGYHWRIFFHFFLLYPLLLKQPLAGKGFEQGSCLFVYFPRKKYEKREREI